MNLLTNFAEGVELVGDGQDTLVTDINSIISVIIGALGLVAVVVIIIGGVNYMTSSGDAGKVKKAKDTILYGVIGLVVCALSFAMVNWVIGPLLGGGSGGGSNSSNSEKVTKPYDERNPHRTE